MLGREIMNAAYLLAFFFIFYFFKNSLLVCDPVGGY